MPAPKSIVDLVDRFHMHQDSYKASNYNETQLRREFVDPLCKALGWDIDNEQGYAEAYKDVVHEDAIKIGGNTKAPDYAFRVGGTRKFFLEAKKPSINIKTDISPAFQLRRYAWSAKLPLSILTDFEELAVYDCRIKPEKGDKASVARISYYTFDQYLDRWDEIASIFSRDSILKGSFDKYADDNKRKRGTAEVDDAFLGEIEGWRLALAKNFALRNPTLSISELNGSVQKTIDRIVFLRIAEDRGIEPYGQLQKIAAGKSLYTQLGTLFQQADARYNSGLFHFRRGDGSDETLDEFTLHLVLDDKTLKPILSSLYYPDSPYEFSVLPADILGQVYERFLGKIIRFSGRTAVIEDKPDVKKSGGVYYTPAYISKYIVENAVGPLLTGQTPSQVSGLDKRRRNQTPLRIVDPACGSGSFLIEAYQFLMNWYRDEYIRDDPQKYASGRDPKIYQAAPTDWHLTIAERRRILLTHIFGVDIDSQAVEVTKLSLLLKVLEGESSDAIARQMDLFKVRALPDLGANIRCGNSLIDSDFYRSYSLSLLTEDDKFRLNVFDWRDEFPFLRKSGGFDCVIGNPPYLYSAGSDYISHYQTSYRFSNYQTDFYVYFVERGLSLLREGGAMSYIVPDSWLNSDSFHKMRYALVNEWQLERICIYKYNVFRSANIENSVFLVRNRAHVDKTDIYEFKSPTESLLVNSLSVEDINRLGIIDPGHSMTGETIISHLDSFDKLASLVTLNRGIHAYRPDGYGKTAFGHGHQTKRDKDERSYHSDVKKDKTYLPELRGRDVFWCRSRYSGQYISYGEWLAEPRNPKFIVSPKVVFRKTLGNILSVALVREPAAVDQSLYIAIAEDDDEDVLKFVMGVTASSLGAWFLRTKYSIYDKLHPWYTKKQLEGFPVPPFNKTVVDVVTSILAVQDAETSAKTEGDRRRAQRESAVYRKDLDDAVFASFGLSEEQRAFIRAATAID